MQKGIQWWHVVIYVVLALNAGFWWAMLIVTWIDAPGWIEAPRDWAGRQAFRVWEGDQDYIYISEDDLEDGAFVDSDTDADRRNLRPQAVRDVEERLALQACTGDDADTGVGVAGATGGAGAGGATAGGTDRAGPIIGGENLEEVCEKFLENYDSDIKPLWVFRPAPVGAPYEARAMLTNPQGWTKDSCFLSLTFVLDNYHLTSAILRFPQAGEAEISRWCDALVAANGAADV